MGTVSASQCSSYQKMCYPEQKWWSLTKKAPGSKSQTPLVKILPFCICFDLNNIFIINDSISNLSKKLNPGKMCEFQNILVFGVSPFALLAAYT